jgi:hypothetical protein
LRIASLRNVRNDSALGYQRKVCVYRKKDKRTLYHSRVNGNLGQAHLNAKYEPKNARYLAFQQRKIDICAIRHFQQAETNMEKDKPFNLIDVSAFFT